ncbi:MAG: FeoA family protein [Puniceicoccales bacterium]
MAKNHTKMGEGIRGSLDQLPLGYECEISSVDDACPSATRLSSLGFLPGQILRLARVAPLGDPIAVDLGGQRIGLRKVEARAIRIGQWREFSGIGS